MMHHHLTYIHPLTARLFRVSDNRQAFLVSLAARVNQLLTKTGQKQFQNMKNKNLKNANGNECSPN